MGLPGARFDEFVGVEESEVQLFGDESAHGGFARAHEADERDVFNSTRVVHEAEV